MKVFGNEWSMYGWGVEVIGGSIGDQKGAFVHKEFGCKYGRLMIKRVYICHYYRLKFYFVYI